MLDALGPPCLSTIVRWKERRIMRTESNISLSLSPRLEPGEKVLYFKPIVWVASGSSLPSFRVALSIPPIQEMGLYVTNRRVVLPAWVLRLFRVEWTACFGEVDQAADHDFVERVSVGRNRLFGPYLELITCNPVEHWWRSRKARIRLFMKSPELLCRLISEALGPTTPTSEQPGAGDAGLRRSVIPESRAGAPDPER